MPCARSSSGMRGPGAGRAGAGARALAWLAGALLAGALPASASDLTGRADLTYGQDEALTSSSDYLRQTYTLSFRRAVTRATSYQLTMRYRDDRGELQIGESRSDLRRRLLEPSGSIEHRMETFGFTLAYRLNEERTLVQDPERFVNRSIERYSGMLYVRPFDDAEVTVSGDRLAFRGASIDTLDQRLGVAFRYTNETLRLVNEFRVQRVEDQIAQHVRTSIGPRLTAAYVRSFGPRYTVSAQYVADYFLTQQNALATAPVTVAVEAQPAAGLFTVDDLPIDTVPLGGEPRLVDRALDASAGISVGPDGVSFNNVGLDLGRFVSLTELRVHVRDAAGAPVPFGGSVSWAVYYSQDGLRWARIDEAIAAFSGELSAYVARFPPTSARFFKVVNFGVNTIETLVTELQAFADETIQPDAPRRSHAVRQGMALSLTAKPAEKVVLDYAGLLNADVVAPDRGPRRWFTDSSNAANARFGPYGAFFYSAGQTFTLARDPGGLTQSAWVSSGSIRFRPIERYDSTLSAHVGRQRFETAFPPEAVHTTNFGAALANRLEVYDALRVGVTAGVSRQEVAAGAVTDYVTGSAYAHADLRRNLWLRLESNLQRSLSRSGAEGTADQSIPLLRIVSYQQHAAEARFQPTSQLGLGARVGYVSAEAGEGVIQSYQANWSPFRGGTVQFATDYSQDVDPLTGRSFRRIGASARWQINPHAQLQLSYNNSRGTGDRPVRQESVFLTFSLML